MWWIMKKEQKKHIQSNIIAWKKKITVFLPHISVTAWSKITFFLDSFCESSWYFSEDDDSFITRENCLKELFPQWHSHSSVHVLHDVDCLTKINKHTITVRWELKLISQYYYFASALTLTVDKNSKRESDKFIQKILNRFCIQENSNRWWKISLSYSSPRQ